MARKKKYRKLVRCFRLTFVLAVVFFISIAAVLVVLKILDIKKDGDNGNGYENTVSEEEFIDKSELAENHTDKKNMATEESIASGETEDSKDDTFQMPDQAEATYETSSGVNADDPEADFGYYDERPALKVIMDGDDLLALVTKETTLRSDYVPSDLKLISSSMNPYYDMELRAEALENLRLLFYYAYKDGIILSIRSAYRSYSTQQSLFQDYASRYGEEEANRFSARPGQSEHQLGTTVDFGGTDVDFTAEFALTEEGLWLAENAHRFGFVMSYPEGREDTTGYIFEPWHFRYIGIRSALELKRSGLTLKEYLEVKHQKLDENR